MAQYRFEFLDADRKPITKCHYQIMQCDSTLRKDVADENGRAAFDSELIAGKKIWVRFWAQGQRQDAAFSTQPFYWAENVITQPIMAPRVYEIKLRETENKNNESEDYRQAFYEVQAGDTWEGIAQKCNTNVSLIKFINNLPDDGTPPEVGDALLLPRGAERPLDSGGRPDKGVIESQPSDPLDDLLKGLDGKTSEQKKDDQPILPQGAEPVGQGQPAQPAGKNPPPDEGKPAEEKRFEPAEEKPDIQKGRGRNGRPTDRVIPKQQPSAIPNLITMEQMKGMWPLVSQSKMRPILDELNANLTDYKLDTNLRKAHFFAQVMQEVGPHFKLREDLHYGAKALLRFSYYQKHPSEATTDANLSPFSLKEKTIANKAYMDKWRSRPYKLGNIYEGDGYKFIGRGLKQTTGRSNYTDLNNVYPLAWPGENLNFLEHPELLETPKYAVRSAIAFWKGKKLYELADKGFNTNTVDSITRVMNKATDSYPQRRANFSTTIKIFR